MRVLTINIIPICFLILAGFLSYFDKSGSGWCIFGAIVCYVYPENIRL